jgi:hypothetical protein
MFTFILKIIFGSFEGSSGVASVNFNGIDLYIPGYYAKRNTSGASVGGATSSNAVIIGECKGGIPFNADDEYPNPEERINWVSNTLELNAILRDGPAYYGALFALTPTNQEGVGTPQQIGVIRINKATKSQRTILNTESANVLVLKSKDYGLYTTQIRTKISSGSIAGKKVTAIIEETTIEIDNITNEQLKIQYTGSGSACPILLDPATPVLTTISGTNTGGSPTILTASTTGISVGMVLYAGGTADITGPVVGTVLSFVADTSITLSQNLTNANSTSKTFFFKSGCLTTSSTIPSDNICIDLGSYDTVGNLVAYINTLANYSSEVVSDGSLLVSKLDKIILADAINIKTEKTISAILEEIINQINNNSMILTATLSTGAVRRLPANDVDYVFLSGGSEGSTPIQQDYQDALDEICLACDISLLGATTSDLAIQSAISAHCTYMSGTIGRNERQACFGAGINDSESTIKSNAVSLNNALVGYTGTPIKRYDKNGILITFDPFYYACEILGLASGNGVTFAPTNKMINCVSATKKYTVPQKNSYIKSGVMVAEQSSLGGIRTVRSITTYQSANIILNEWSAMRTILYITKDHRTYLEEKIGLPGDATILESLKNRAQNRLDYYVDQGYFVVDPAKGNAYRNVKFKVTGDVFEMTYEATVVVPINFILVTHNFTVIGAVSN